MKSQDTKKAAPVAPARADAPRLFDRPDPAALGNDAAGLEGAVETARRLGHSFAAMLPVPPGTPAPVQARLVMQPAAADRVLRPSGSGAPLPEETRRRMESGFGADFSDVRTHVGSEAPSIGAVAYTRGSNIHFAPGRYNPASSEGQKLLAHELTHVVQQRAGRVPVPSGPGLPINDSPALEREADALGAKALSAPTPKEEE